MKLSLIAGTVLLGAAALLANWGSDAGGSVGTGTFGAFGTNQVEMQSENLTIALYHDRAKVTVEYVMKNRGDAIDVKAGFPCLGLESPGKNYLEIEDYQLTADGTPVPHQTEKGDVK